MSTSAVSNLTICASSAGPAGSEYTKSARNKDALFSLIAPAGKSSRSNQPDKTKTYNILSGTQLKPINTAFTFLDQLQSADKSRKAQRKSAEQTKLDAESPLSPTVVAAVPNQLTTATPTVSVSDTHKPRINGLEQYLNARPSVVAQAAGTAQQQIARTQPQAKLALQGSNVVVDSGTLPHTGADAHHCSRSAEPVAVNTARALPQAEENLPAQSAKSVPITTSTDRLPALVNRGAVSGSEDIAVPVLQKSSVGDNFQPILPNEEAGKQAAIVGKEELQLNPEKQGKQQANESAQFSISDRHRGLAATGLSKSSPGGSSHPNVKNVQALALDDAGNDSPSKGRPNSDFLRSFTDSEVQVTVSDRPAAPAQPAGATAETVPSDGPRTLTEQVSESIQSSFRNASSHPADGNQVTVRLDPPELGKVLITFQQREGEIVGLLRVTQSQTRYEIEQTLPQVLRTLQDSGIGIRRLEVHLADQNEPQMDRDQLFQDGSFRQPDFAQNGHSGNDSPGQWMVANDAGDDIAEPHAYINDGAIDVLV